jgi:hypothetical protein
MTIDYEFVHEIFNKEITKLRRDVYEAYESLLIQYYCPNDVEKAWVYFRACPMIESLNRKSWDMLKEYCEAAKEYRESKDK